MSSYLGNIPSNNFVSLKRQVITGNGGASYTLDYSVASVNDVAIFVNNVRQDPASYSISTTSLTLGGTISSSDSCYVLFLGQGIQSVKPANNTIVNDMIVDGTIAESKLASGVNTITMADQWRLTASTNSGTDADVTSNWERNDSTNYGRIGTGLTESSGIFSFPSTGIYLIIFTGTFTIASGERQVRLMLRTTNDDTNYYDAADVICTNRGGSIADASSSSTFMFDVTNTTTHKFKFETKSFSSGSVLVGNTNYNETCFSVLRMGDT
tara:strand:- start:62 stop:865 length:804 start_codon:yes stop_codon:yes gene_type:complete